MFFTIKFTGYGKLMGGAGERVYWANDRFRKVQLLLLEHGVGTQNGLSRKLGTIPCERAGAGSETEGEDTGMSQLCR